LLKTSPSGFNISLGNTYWSFHRNLSYFRRLVLGKGLDGRTFAWLSFTLRRT
jgi:hypothetical protein